MKFKILYLITFIGCLHFSSYAQKGVRIGYIDTEYILQNVPEYKEASAQLDQKILGWKSDIEKQLNAIAQKKQELENEKVLLTKELYDTRLEDITFEENEILDYQQKRFGPDGDLITQKRQLIEPIQDQIFAAVKQIAETKKYDFVFDKSADVVMLYSAERYDISEQVLRTITRTSKRNQAKNKKERKKLEDESLVPEVDKSKEARQQQLDEKKAQREKELEAKRQERVRLFEERKRQQDSIRTARKEAAKLRRQKATEAKQNATKKTTDTSESSKTNKPSAETSANKSSEKDAKKDTKKLTPAEQKAADRAKRRKALEDKKKKILEERKKAREEREKQIKRRDSIAKAKKTE